MRGNRVMMMQNNTPIWSGGERSIIVCGLTKHYAWLSWLHESEGANGRRNVTGNGRRRWQLAGPTLEDST